LGRDEAIETISNQGLESLGRRKGHRVGLLEDCKRIPERGWYVLIQWGW